MKEAPIPADDDRRLAELHAYDILDTADEADFDAVVRLAAEICHTPMANVSFVDRDRQWFKAVVGLDERETPRAVAFCGHTILGHDHMAVGDAAQDERFRDNPLVTGGPHIRFYVGIPLRTPTGHNLGALCAMDREPRHLTQEQIDALHVLASHVMTLLELRRRNRELERLSESRSQLLTILAHDVRSPLANLRSLARLVMDGRLELDAESRRGLATELDASAARTEELINTLIAWGATTLDPRDTRKGRVDLVRVLRDEAARAAPVAEAKATSIELDLPTGPIDRPGSPDAIAFIVRNVLSNAIKFTSGGTVRVSLEEHAHRWRISIADTGTGMPAERAATLFTWRDRQQTSGTAGEQGSGVAAMLIGDLARASGISVAAESSPGNGTRVTIDV